MRKDFSKPILENGLELNYKQKCALLKLDPFWFSRLKLNLRFSDKT